jgi:hypothetical protein
LKRCTNCGHENSDFFNSCENCHSALSGSSKDDVAYYAPQRSGDNDTWALVCGILSILCCGIILGPIAIMLGSSSESSTGQAGKILGIIGLCLWGFGLLFRMCASF